MMPFTQQELTAAVAQMKDQHAADIRFAELAAHKLQQTMPGSHVVAAPVHSHAHPHSHSFAQQAVSAEPIEYELQVRLTQYDDWKRRIQILKEVAGVDIGEWTSGSFHHGPEGTYNLSSDPEFAEHSTKTYKVRVTRIDCGA